MLIKDIKVIQPIKSRKKIYKLYEKQWDDKVIWILIYLAVYFDEILVNGNK